MSSQYFELIQLVDNINFPVKQHLAKYVRFENVHYGITESENQEEIKLDAMHSLLEEQGLTWEMCTIFLHIV